jgi:putative effector of murein hydrolase
METIISLPVCGLFITIVCYLTGIFVRKLIPSPLTNPMVIANALIVLLILYTPLTLEQYLAGGNIITLFIGPVTVILALRIYQQWEQLKANIIPILGGCFAGSAASLFSIWSLCKLFHIDRVITLSVLPKSVTTAIALELTKRSGGLAGLAVSGVIVTGVSAAVFCPFFIRVFRLRDPLAAGIAMGTSGHAIGTAAAIELGEVQGAMSGAAIGISGIITSVMCISLF